MSILTQQAGTAQALLWHLLGVAALTFYTYSNCYDTQLILHPIMRMLDMTVDMARPRDTGTCPDGVGQCSILPCRECNPGSKCAWDTHCSADNMMLQMNGTRWVMHLCYYSLTHLFTLHASFFCQAAHRFFRKCW